MMPCLAAGIVEIKTLSCSRVSTSLESCTLNPRVLRAKPRNTTQCGSAAFSATCNPQTSHIMAIYGDALFWEAPSINNEIQNPEPQSNLNSFRCGIQAQPLRTLPGRHQAEPTAGKSWLSRSLLGQAFRANQHRTVVAKCTSQRKDWYQKERGKQRSKNTALRQMSCRGWVLPSQHLISIQRGLLDEVYLL